MLIRVPDVIVLEKTDLRSRIAVTVFSRANRNHNGRQGHTPRDGDGRSVQVGRGDETWKADCVGRSVVADSDGADRDCLASAGIRQHGRVAARGITELQQSKSV